MSGEIDYRSRTRHVFAEYAEERGFSSADARKELNVWRCILIALTTIREGA